MAKFDAADARKRYQRLMAARPELLSTPPGGGIEILVEPDDIRRAEDEARRTRKAQGLENDDFRTGVLAEDTYMTFVRDAVRFGDGSLGLYNRIVEGPCVAVLPVLDGKVVLIYIFRHGLRQWCWEAPRGDVKTGETAATAAVRELAEEIGAEVKAVQNLGPFTPGGASLAILGQLFHATIDGLGGLAKAESIRDVRTVTPQEVGAMIADGQIIDGFTIALFARARLSSLI